MDPMGNDNSSRPEINPIKKKHWILRSELARLPEPEKLLIR